LPCGTSVPSRTNVHSSGRRRRFIIWLSPLG
jgi:hypothetical protein